MSSKNKPSQLKCYFCNLTYKLYAVGHYVVCKYCYNEGKITEKVTEYKQLFIKPIKIKQLPLPL